VASYTWMAAPHAKTLEAQPAYSDLVRTFRS
jgi:hypothetical protein